MEKTNKQPGPMHQTCILLSEDDLEALRDLARIRARRLGGRVSNGAEVRRLVRAEHARAIKGGDL